MKSERNADYRGLFPPQTVNLSAEGHHPALSRQSVWDSLVTHCLLSSDPLVLTAHGSSSKTFSIFETLCSSVQRSVPMVSPWTAGFYQS